MNIWQRVAWYVLGVGLGTLLAYFFFADRDFQCTYFPNNRVLVDLHDQPVYFVDSGAFTIWMDEAKGDSAFLEAFLIRGEIDFSESQVTTRDKNLKYSTYSIQLDWKEKKFLGEWQKRKDSAVLVALKRL